MWVKAKAVTDGAMCVRMSGPPRLLDGGDTYYRVERRSVAATGERSGG